MREATVGLLHPGEMGAVVGQCLTAAGHALVERVVDQVLGREALLVQGLRPAERTALVALLDRLLRDVTRQVQTGVSAGTP